MKAWLFDVDGVITNPEEKIANPAVLSEIAKKLEQGEPVALATGRSIEWLKERLISDIKERVNADLLENLFISGEFGEVSIRYADGKEKKR